MKKKFIASLIAILIPFYAQSASTEATLADACVKFWENGIVDQAQFKQTEPKFRKMCECQAKAVFAGGFSNEEIEPLEQFMSGHAVQSADLQKSAKAKEVFDANDAPCEKAAMN